MEGGLGLLLAGLAAGGPGGCALAAAGALALAAGLLRRRGVHADRRLLEPFPQAATPAGIPEPGEDHLGLAHTLLPVLDVTEVADRNLPADAPGLGVLSDGRGCAAVLAFPAGTLPDLPAALLGAWLDTDPARPAAAQLLVEQFGPPPWDLQYGYRPTIAYRALPGGPRPLAVRSWLVLRYEAFGAPEAAERRGGGLAGARAATAAATARIRARLAAAGAPTTPLGAPELRELLRQVGDPAGEGRSLPDSWAGIDFTHCCLAAPLDSPVEWTRLLHALAGCTAERVVAATTLTREGGALRALTAVRVVGMRAQHAAEERARLLRSGILRETPTDQRAGLLATLPVAHPFRSPAETAGLVSPGAPR
ncbi:type VII secretion protein EccE [Streptomyces hoynatensis]|uniref:type VII secretion protein EccE n=1 Tax=Streptomyces hoynatensis TaxID=1141874 RepID=UPI00131A357D|nr:type VII secretion protein EccE [Streptomyces hoynatensis]